MKLVSMLLTPFVGCLVGMSVVANELLAQAFSIVNGSGQIFVEYDPNVLDPANNPPPTGALNPSSIEFPFTFNLLTPSGVAQITTVNAINNPNTGNFASFQRNGGGCGLNCYRITFADSGTLTGNASGNVGGQISFTQINAIFAFDKSVGIANVDIFDADFTGPFAGVSVENFQFKLTGGTLAIPNFSPPQTDRTNINLVQDSATASTLTLTECSPINVSRIYPAVNCASFKSE